MEKFHLHLEYTLYDTEELEEQEQALLRAAMEATHRAYAPYSQFFVGAAVLLQDGQIFTGNNQENAAYPSGICAERNVLFHVGAIGMAQLIKAIAIRVRTPNVVIDQPIYPCGACRQVMLEYEQQLPNNQTIKIFMQGQTGKVLIAKSVKDYLLPLIFELKK